MQTSYEPSTEDRYPKFTILTASRLTGLKPGTLRAWERRYGVPSPHRTPSGQRLYAEYDLRLVRWLAAQTDSGMTIGRVVDFLHHLQSRGQDPIGSASVSQSEPAQGTSVREGVSQDEQS